MEDKTVVDMIEDIDEGMDNAGMIMVKEKSALNALIKLGVITPKKWKGIHIKLGALIKEENLTESQLKQVYELFALGNAKTDNMHGAERSAERVLLIHKALSKHLVEIQLIQDLPEFQLLQDIAIFYKNEASCLQKKDNHCGASLLFERIARIDKALV